MDEDIAANEEAEENEAKQELRLDRCLSSGKSAESGERNMWTCSFLDAGSGSVRSFRSQREEMDHSFLSEEWDPARIEDAYKKLGEKRPDFCPRHPNQRLVYYTFGSCSVFPCLRCVECVDSCPQCKRDGWRRSEEAIVQRQFIEREKSLAEEYGENWLHSPVPELHYHSPLTSVSCRSGGSGGK